MWPKAITCMRPKAVMWPKILLRLEVNRRRCDSCIEQDTFSKGLGSHGAAKILVVCSSSKIEHVGKGSLLLQGVVAARDW